MIIIDGFDPTTPRTVDPQWLQTITFNRDGYTDDDNFAWSGTILMDLDSKEALEITPKKIHGTEFLFIEAGGLSKPGANGTWHPDHPVGWQPELYVMKRKQEEMA